MRMRILIVGAILALAAGGCAHSPEIPRPQPPPPQVSASQQPTEEEIKARVASLINQLASEEYKTREGAQAELRKLLCGKWPALVLGNIVEACKVEEDPEVRHRLEQILSPYNKWRITPALLEHFPGILNELECNAAMNRERVAAELGRQKTDAALPVLVKLLEDDDDSVSKAAIQALADTGKAAVEPLIETLRSESWVLRFRAARVLGIIRDKRSVAPLIQALNDESDHVRNWAAAALAKMPDARAIGPLIVALKDDDYLVRGCAATALGNIGSSKAVAGLMEVLKDEQWEVRYCAAQALGRIGDESALTALLASMKDSKQNVRTAAAEALAKIGAPAITPLVEKLQDKDEESRRLAAKALGQMRDRAAVKPLIEKLRVDDSWWVREAIAQALGEIADERAIGPLIDSLKDDSGWIPRRAAEALKKMTQHDFGEDYDKWKEWYEKGGKE